MPAPPPKKNHAWIYFFAFLIVASVGVCVFMICFNLWIQLTPEQLEEARQVWKENDIKNYNMIYTKNLNDKIDTFVVKVRADQVVEARMNGEPLSKETRVYYSMDRLFADIERFMTMDQNPNAPKVYTIGRFDPKTGAVLYYVRRVMGTKDRVEINVTLEAVE